MIDDTVSESIRQFFGGNFHQDWDLVAEDWHGVVDNYTAGKDAARLLQLAEDIDDLRQNHAANELEVLMLRHAHCAYSPRPLSTYHEWLGQITDRLRLCAEGIESEGPSGQ